MNGDSAPPPPPGFDLTAPPPPPTGGAALSFQGQWNPETKQWEDVPVEGDVPPPPPGFDLTSAPEPAGPGAAERFARSFNQATTGYQGPADVLRDVKDNLWYELTRQRDTWEDTKNVWHGMKTQMDATWDRAVEDAKNGNVSSLQGLINYTNSGIHMLESGVPVIGPALAQADKQISNGDYAGGLGTFLGTALVSGGLERAAPSGGPAGVVPGSAVHPGLAPEPFPRVGTAEGAAAPSTGIARAAQLARGAADLGKDSVLGDVIGMASPRIRHAQDFLGRLADVLDKYTQARREEPSAAPTEEIPESDAAIPADLYRQLSNAHPELSDRQIRGLGEQVMQQARGQRIQPPEGIAVPPSPTPEATAPTPPPSATQPTLEEAAIQPPAGRPEQAQAYREAQVVGRQGEAPTPPPEALKTYAGTPTNREEAAAQWRAWQRGEGPMPRRPAVSALGLPPEEVAAETAPPAWRVTPPEHAAFGGAPGAEVPSGTEVPSVLDHNHTQALSDNEIVAKLRDSLEEESRGWKAVKSALSGEQNTIITPKEFEDASAAWRSEVGSSNVGIPLTPKAIANFAKIGTFHFERLGRAGVVGIEEWSRAMTDQLGDRVKPYLDGLWDQLTKKVDEAKVQATRKPTGANATEDYTTQPLVTDRSVYDVGAAKGNKPAVVQDYADLVTGKKIPREPMRDDQFRGEPRFANDQEFQDAHADWEKKTTPYIGFKTALTDPGKIVDAFVQHLVDNKRTIWNMIPEHLREEWMQWYDTARTQAIRLGAKTGITNEQGAGLIATQSPQKDWFQNLSLADRMNDIWHGQQDTVTDGKMLKAGREIADSQTIVQVMRSRILEGRTLAELDSPEVMAKLERSSLPKLRRMAASPNAAADLQGIWVRLYDEAHGDPSFGTTNALGEDMGPARNADGSPTPVAWQSTNAVGKGISILKDGSLPNILEQLGEQHKVPNFNNNVLAPDHPAGFYTADTHDVAAGLGRPLGSSAVEVDHNFGGSSARSHADTGLSGTYGLHAEAGRQLAAELDMLPRQVQSVVWEGIRKLFPDTFKTDKNLAKIDNLWRQYEEGDLTHAQVWQGIFKARAEAGLDTKTGGVPKDFTLTREQYNAARESRLGTAGTLDRLQPVGNQPELGQTNGGREVGNTRKTPSSVVEPEVGETVPLRAARRAKRNP